jgi:(p)ppGpp synthase/HD superfamily hydrolase
MDIRDITYVMNAHQNFAKKPNKAYRKWDGKTPYYNHPIWCATMITTETFLDEKTREEGIQALLYHDLIEDTNMPLPNWLSDQVEELVLEMTFPEGSIQEMEEIWEKPPEIKLYKLYDKVSNLLDGSWMNEEKRQTYEKYTERLCEEVENNYGTLNITKMMRGMVEM